MKVAVTGAAGQIGYSLLFRIGSGSMLGPDQPVELRLIEIPNAVSNLAIWGNHSSTQYPHFYNTKIDDKPATEVIKDEPWLKESFIPIVQQRGAAIIKARGASSAASAANAAIDTVWSLINPTPAGDWHSVAVHSDGSYGFEKGLISSFKIHSHSEPLPKRLYNLKISRGLWLANFSGYSLTQQLTEYKLQDASVPVVVHLDWRINAELDRLLNGGTLLACDAQSDILTWRDIVGEPKNVEDFRPLQTQGPSGDALRELERKHARPNEV